MAKMGNFFKPEGLLTKGVPEAATKPFKRNSAQRL